ncbi:MAG: C-GCAxxG-C-C family protein [Firmicutes bacterium]|nr:C-GCAxxG-C-C family protein [Bacillota bacterium]
MKSAREYYLDENYNCAESTIRGLNDSLGLGLDDENMKLLAGFGGGMASGLACGVLCGCVGAIGKMMVTDKAHNCPEEREACKEFVALFAETFGDTNCSYLVEKYKRPDIRCAILVEEAQKLFENFMKEKGIVK